VGYVLTANSLNAHKSDISTVNQEIANAKGQIGAQSAFGDFHKIKDTRVTSVRQLADDRFDWERHVRELSLVLPSGTSLTELNASKGPQPQAIGGASSGSSSPSSSGSTSTDPSSAGLPSLHLLGCAAHQKNVAVMLVRLRQMSDVDTVDLAESSEQVPSDSGGASSASPASSGSGDGCSPKTFKFDVTVTFKQAQPKRGSGRVPARLGGGS
jgi:hypothetical protein